MGVDYEISLTSPDYNYIEKRWKELESRAIPNFFLSWCWVKSWLETFRPSFQLIEIEFAGRIVGLGLLTNRREIRHFFIPSRVLRLGQTGNSKQDQIWIEYNDLLLDVEHRDTIPEAVVRFLLLRQDWDEFQLGATLDSRVSLYQSQDVTPVVKWQAPTYAVNLDAIRVSGKCYLQTLSRNTRYKINRTRREYEAVGALSFKVHDSPDAVSAALDQIAPMHIKRWGAKESGFSNPWFLAFHKNLIFCSSSATTIQVCELRVGSTLIGMLYNFVHRNTIYFYLSGLDYNSADEAMNKNRLNPGLLLHAMAIEHYLREGFCCYDFMGGDARYKKSLAEKRGELQLVSFQRSGNSLVIERFLRRLKHQLGTFIRNRNDC